MTKLSLTDEQRRDIVRYRLETALSTLSEVESHKANGFYNTAVNRLLVIMPLQQCSFH